jgi:hypothetical protein
MIEETASPPVEFRQPPNGILIVGKSLLGRAIRWASGRYSHYEAILDEKTSVGAVAGGFLRHDIQEVLTWGTATVIAPPIERWTAADLDRYLRYLAWLEGAPYDFASLPLYWMGLETASKLNCSEAGMYAWDELLRCCLSWPLQNRRLKMATPEDMRVLGRRLWTNNPAEADLADLKAFSWKWTLPSR